MFSYINLDEPNKKIFNNLFTYVVASLTAYLFYYCFCPGFISTDTLEQYKQAAGLIDVYTAHPVIMTYLWMLIIKLTGKPEFLFLVLQLFYWLTVALISNVIFKKASHRLLTLFFIGFWPPAFILSLNVWKDVFMLAALLFASISAYAYAQVNGRRWLFFSLLGLFIATAVRINGFIPSLFIATGLFGIYFLRLNKTKIKSLFFGVSTAVLFILSCFVFISMINIKAQKTYDLGTLGVWDMVSISIDKGENILPDYLLTGKDKNKLIDNYKRYNSTEANFPVYSFVSPYPPQENQIAFKYDWLNAIAENPESYLKHRWHVFEVLSGKMVNGHTYYPFQQGIQSNSYGFYFQNLNTDTAKTIIDFLALVSDSVFFKVYIYYVISIALILVSLRNVLKEYGGLFSNVVILGISMSGLVSNLSLFFLATAADFRYSIWTISSVVLALAIVISRRITIKK